MDTAQAASGAGSWRVVAMAVGLKPDEVEDAVRKAVAEQPVVDLHTHLLPPSFDEMMLWGGR